MRREGERMKGRERWVGGRGRIAGARERTRNKEKDEWEGGRGRKRLKGNSGKGRKRAGE